MSNGFKWSLIGIVMAFILGFSSGIWVKGSKASSKIQAMESQAQELKGKIEAEVQHSTELAAKDQVNQQAVTDAHAKVQQLQAKVDQDKKQLAALQSQPPATGPIEDPTKDAIISSLTKMNQDQSLLIDGLKSEGTAKDERINGLILDRDNWKQIATDAQKEARLREIAMDAQKSAIASSRWKGRLEGALIGAIGGFIGGRH